MDRLTGGQADRQTCRHIYIQTDRHTGSHTDGQAYGQSDRYNP